MRGLAITMAEAPPEFCSVDDCEEEARGPYCDGHWKRLQRGQEMAGPIATRPKTPWERLFNAALALADCDSEDDYAFHLARSNLRKSALAYAESLRGDGQS